MKKGTKKAAAIGGTTHARLAAACHKMQQAGGVMTLTPSDWLLLIAKYGPVVEKVIEDILTILHPPQPAPTPTPSVVPAGGEVNV